jgi:hypothetical protein
MSIDFNCLWSIWSACSPRPGRLDPFGLQAGIRGRLRHWRGGGRADFHPADAGDTATLGSAPLEAHMNLAAVGLSPTPDEPMNPAIW